MAKTLLVLKTYYSNIMRTDFAHIPSAAQTTLETLASQIDKGTITLADAQGQIAKLAAGTTSVASLSYSFFTGGVPSAAGFDYLVSPNGPNPNNLNSAYYQSFSAENRYINFAVNLGKSGEALTWFTANYGGLSMADALAKAYTEIFGTAPDAAKINALLNDQVPDGLGGTYSRQQYFAVYGGDGVNGLATKAAMVGWLMAEAVKSGIGAYAKANEAFLADLGADGVAAFRSGLTVAYGTPPAGAAGATLTIAADKSISPNATDAAQKSTVNNDTLTGTNGLNADQTVDAGAGRDKIDLSGTISGKITTADGGDTLVLGSLAQGASVNLGASGNTVTLKGGLAQGASLNAAGTANVLHIDSDQASLQGSISGFQTVYLHSNTTANLEGASVIYDVVDIPTAEPFRVEIAARAGQIVVLKDTPHEAVISHVGQLGSGRTLDVHLQNFKGSFATATEHGNGINMFVQLPNSEARDLNAALILHVDSDSTSGIISGSTSGGALGTNHIEAIRNLKIIGPGKLTAQLGNFSNIDATQAGDLALSYRVPVNVQEDILLRLGDGNNTLKLAFDGTSQGNVSLGSVKIHLGAGTDNLILAGSYREDPTSTPKTGVLTLSNLQIKDGGAISAPPEIVGFQKGIDHFVLDAQVHAMTADVQQYADGKASLLAALTEVAAHTAANTGAVFTWNGDTYIFSQDGVAGLNMRDQLDPTKIGDGLIKLVGVTGLSVGTGAGAFDIHYG